MMKDGYRVRTEVKENGKIEQTVVRYARYAYEEIVEPILNRVVDTEEK